MQQQRKFHLKHRSKFSQLILLDEQAYILSSCDSIFEPPSKENPVTEWSPFMESIYANLWDSLSEQSSISFNKIQTPIAELPGIYDFTFSRVTIDQKELILWSIYDYTVLYEDFKQFQQRKNELEIHRETLERRHKSVQHIEDVNIQQNIIIENLDHVQLTYFNKIKSALLAPVNALDGITFLLARALEKKDQKYTQQLRLVLKQLTLILDELDQVQLPDTKELKPERFPLSSLCEEIKNLVLLKNNAVAIKVVIDPQIPERLGGNELYLRQVLFGIIDNAATLHPNSTFEIKAIILKQMEDRLRLQFKVTEYLEPKTSLPSQDNYTTMNYQLSIIKQLIDLQKGNIYVDKSPKDLSISITFELEYTYLTI